MTWSHAMLFCHLVTQTHFTILRFLLMNNKWLTYKISSLSLLGTQAANIFRYDAIIEIQLENKIFIALLCQSNFRCKAISKVLFICALFLHIQIKIKFDWNFQFLTRSSNVNFLKQWVFNWFYWGEN